MRQNNAVHVKIHEHALIYTLHIGNMHWTIASIIIILNDNKNSLSDRKEKTKSEKREVHAWVCIGHTRDYSL